MALSVGGGPTLPDEAPDAMGGGDDAGELAASALLKAIERKDPAGLKAAFAALLDAVDDEAESADSLDAKSAY